MKINRSILIPMATVILISIFIMIYQKTPLLPTLTPIIIVSIALVVQKKSNNNFKFMWLFGIIAGFLYIGMILGLIYLARNHYWAESIFKFPYY